MNMPRTWSIPLILFLSAIFSGCAEVTGPPEFVDMDFAALANGTDASIIHVDTTGHATVEPIDFLKGHSLLAWAMAGLDRLVTCEKSVIAENELEFNFYDHKTLTRTIRLATTTNNFGLNVPGWMFLPPEGNYLFLSSPEQDRMIRFDLRTGDKTDVRISSEMPPGEIFIDRVPLWDAERDELIIKFEVRPPGDKPISRGYLGRLDPETFALKFQLELIDIPLIYETGVYELLAYNQGDNTVVFYGECGSYLQNSFGDGNQGFYTMSLNTARPKFLATDVGIQLPGLTEVDPYAMAVIDRRYVVTTRSLRDGSWPNQVDPHTYILDLKTRGAKMVNIPYLTRIIGHEGLHL